MRLRATISIDFDATSFITAGVIQQKLEKLLTYIHENGYPEAQLEIKERRPRTPAESGRPAARMRFPSR